MILANGHIFEFLHRYLLGVYMYMCVCVCMCVYLPLAVPNLDKHIFEFLHRHLLRGRRHPRLFMDNFLENIAKVLHHFLC